MASVPEVTSHVLGPRGSCAGVWEWGIGPRMVQDSPVDLVNLVVLCFETKQGISHIAIYMQKLTADFQQSGFRGLPRI